MGQQGGFQAARRALVPYHGNARPFTDHREIDILPAHIRHLDAAARIIRDDRRDQIGRVVEESAV
jgi:hypothetical protein